MGFPESLCCFKSLYVNVCFLFLVVVLEVSVVDHVVFSHGRKINLFTSHDLRRVGRWSLVWGLEMVFSHADVAHDVVVHLSVFARAEIPRLLFREIRSVLEPHHFVFEVDDVVRLLIAQGSVLPPIG